MAGKNLVIIKIRPLKIVWNKILQETFHISDVYRIFLLTKFGGIYLDDDVVLLKSHSDLFDAKNLPIVAEESAASLANGFMMVPPSSDIFLKWLVEYKTFSSRNKIIGLNSVLKLWCFWQQYPQEIRVIKNKMIRPNWKEKGLLLYGKFDWSEHYNIHLNQRFVRPMLDYFNISLDFNSINSLDTSFGEIIRLALYGNYQKC